jgi:hypothetical protein
VRSTGLRQGNILVNAFHQAGGQFFSDVTGLPDGGFIVTWEDDAGLVERSQRFDEAGNLVGTDFSFPSVVLNNQIPHQRRNLERRPRNFDDQR